MGRKVTAQTQAIEAIFEADAEKGVRRSSTLIAAMFGISGARVRELRKQYEKRVGLEAANLKPSSQPGGGVVAGKSSADAPQDVATPPAPVVVGLHALRPDMSLVPADADLAMFLAMPEDRWTRDDERKLDDSERLAAVLAMRSHQLVPIKTLQKLVGIDRAHWDEMLRADATLRVRLEAWRAKGVVRKMAKLSELSEYARDDIALSAATKLLEQAGGAPDAFGPAVQRLQIEGHHVEERIVYLGEASLFKRPLDLAQALIDEGQLQRGEIVEGEAREVPGLPEASNE